MLTLPEKILFVLAALASLFAVYRAIRRIVLILSRGAGKPDWSLLPKRLVTVLPKLAVLQPTFKIRFWANLFHLLIVWGFLYFLLVNLGDILHGFLPDFHFLGQGLPGQLHRLLADLSSVAVLSGMLAMVIRRFIFRPAILTARHEVLLHPKARSGIRRDSAIVGSFVIVHVCSRLLEQTFNLAREGFDAWQPVATRLASLWSGANPSSLLVAEHIAYWLAEGTILAFLPYFLYSKHVHMFFAPLNFLLKPPRRSIGELSKLDFNDESVASFGASRLEDLGWEQLMDAYACIQCYRCQQVCPAYHTGKVLSPAALEINKRYFVNQQGVRLMHGEQSSQTLVEFAIPEEAIWACTACGDCIDICPVDNEPMRDILDIRRSLVLMENSFPSQLQAAFRGMERNANPWNIAPTERLKWAEGLDVPTIDQLPEPEILWWVGCAPATDTRAQKSARAFAQLLKIAGVRFAVLGQHEQCTGDAARRAGNEFLFNELATANVKILNQVAPKRIVTTCPHCLHTLKNEYPAFGGNYTVIHHTRLINELVASGRLKLKAGARERLTYHDSCYLGRHNHILEDPRQALRNTGAELLELPRHGMRSFCCGAGGAQMWKEEEPGSQRISANRFAEVQASGVSTLAVACPFCMIMLTDARQTANSTIQLLDIAEIVLRAVA